MSSPPPKHSLSSPTSGNTPHPVLPTPSSSTSVSIRQKNKTSQLRQELEQQLIEKQKQLQESSSGIGKNVLARQVSQLQDRIKELDLTPSSSTSNNDESQPSSVDRLRSLERDLTSYRSHPLSPGISSIRNKEKLMNQRSAGGLDPLPSPSTSTLLPPTHGHDSTSLLPLPPPPTGSTPTKRRSKIPNTDRRNTDIEFATEIGQGLLLEVRKMQALLQEKEEKLRTLENQKADLERAAEAMAKQMRQREENEEKLKEETWNLELAKQELTISVTELQQNLSKANVEQNKLAKQVNELRSEIEQLRDREEKLTHTIDNMKQRHEQDMSSIRRHAAAIQREKTDQTKQIEALTSELAIAKAQSRIGKHVSTESEPSIRAGETTDDQTASTLAVRNDTSPSSSPPSSPKQSPARNQAMEVETLKTSLAHAHRMVSNLRSNLHKEKTEKFEFKKLLAESQETIEQLQNDPRMWVDAGPARGTSGSASNITAREDGSLPGRRSHKALTSSKRRGGRKSATGRHRLKGSSQNVTADDDSVYSYSSMSDQEDSDDIDSFDDSDAGFENTSDKKKSVGFTPLSSELSQVQLQKPVMVDAEVNTDPVDDFMLPIPTLQKTEPRSLGNELGMAISQKDKETSLPTTMKNIAGGLVTGAAAALGVEPLSKSTGIEISTQTDVAEEPAVISGVEISVQTNLCEFIQKTTSAISIEPSKPIEFEFVSKNAFSADPEDPSIVLAATTAAIAAARLASLEAGIDSSTQSEPEDPSIALAATTAAIAASRTRALEAAVDSFTQSDEIIDDPSVAEAAKAATAAAIASGIASGIIDSRNAAIEAAIDTSVQYEEDPSIAEAAEAAKATAIAAGIAAGIAESRSKAMEAAIDTSVQYEEDPSIAEAAEAAKATAIAAGIAAGIAESRSKAMEAAINTSVQYEEDPSIAEAAVASAMAASRAASLEAAIDTAVQYEEPEEDPSTVAATAATAAAATAAAVLAARNLALKSAIDSSTQSELPLVNDQETQIDNIKGVDSGVQSIPVTKVDAFIQSEIIETKDSYAQSVQYEDAEVAAAVATPTNDVLGIDHSNQSEVANSIERGVKSDIHTRNADVQHEVGSTDIGVQCGETATHKNAAAIIATPPVSSRTLSESDDEFYDAQSKPSSRRTINSFNNIKPDSRSSQLSEEIKAFHDNNIDRFKFHEENSKVRGVKQHDVSDEAIIAAATTATGAALHIKSESEPEDDTLVRSTGTETQPVQSGTSVSSQDIRKLSDTVPSEKMFSKSETDALIATAVAAALANVASPIEHSYKHESKHHTLDMSNNYDTDSAVMSSSPAVSRTSRYEENENHQNEDYGNVVVHLPREEDTITSLPFDQIAERHRERTVVLSKETVEADYFANIGTLVKAETTKPERPELTKGPTVIFDQEPEEREITEADIPRRPANPPPEELLSRVSRSPTFANNNRSMSPTSLCSKGKAPLENSDLESTSAPSNEDLQRTAALHHQQQLNTKRGSVSASSISTNNTNEQLHSIHSSQNDALTRNSAATDPTMINLITQTMIGDWMYKYTRKTVGGGLSENRHQRYFWIHPYTRTLYWSTSAPGVDGSEAKAKSALIENITSVPDYSNTGNGTPNVSLLIQTSNRQLKLTAPSLEKHELWFEAISHLLARNRNSNGLTLLNDSKKADNPNARSVSSGTTGSLLNRPSFRRLHDIFQQPSSSTSMATSDDHIELDDDDEALEDVRMCCNGKHHVSKLEKDHAHRHQYRKRKSRPAVTTVG